MTQPFRTSAGGRIDRGQRVSFVFDGRRLEGYRGDTLASALLANGIHLVGRSFKYHRPRGILTAGAEEPNALVTIDRGNGRATPNLRATEVEIYDGLLAQSQNRWPSLAFDLGVAGDFLAPLFSAGFYYKTFIGPRWLGSTRMWAKVYEPLIRRAAGLGRAPAVADPDRYATRYAHCDVLVVGAGPAGLSAAAAAARAGARVILCDEHAELGGSLLSETDATAEGEPAAARLDRILASLAAEPRVTLLPRTQAFGLYAQGFAGLVERITDHLAASDPEMPRECLWQVRAERIVLATGAIERPLVFPRNDRPGIVLADAARTYVNRYGVRPGRRAVVLTATDSAYDAALDLHRAGIAIEVIADVRAEARGPAVEAARAAGITIRPATTVVETSGRRRISRVRLAEVSSAGDLRAADWHSCDLLLMSGGWTPSVHLFSQARGKLAWNENANAFLPDVVPENILLAGACRGSFGLETALREGEQAGESAAAHSVATVFSIETANISVMPAQAGTHDSSPALDQATAAPNVGPRLRGDDGVEDGAGPMHPASRGGVTSASSAPRAERLNGGRGDPGPSPSMGEDPGSTRDARVVRGTEVAESWRGVIGALPEGPKSARAFVDFQNDVTTKDLRQAAREGFRSIEHVKRYTTTGMATDQGKTSNVNALAVVAAATKRTIPEVGFTTFRQPYTPVTFGALAGMTRGDLFDPVRRTPTHDWAASHGAVFEDVGLWKRARYFPRHGEDMHEAVARECRAVRSGVGVFDASTLGKIEVMGADAAEFLERIYVNAFHSLAVGRSRYAILLDEAGFVIDDGVIARLAADRFHVTTTTGGAARVLDMMEDYRQTEWPALNVWLTSSTEQWAVVAVQGPSARDVLAPLVDGIDLSRDRLPHMGVVEGRIVGVPCRLFRVSFTGELGFEVNVPADYGQSVWEAIWARASTHDAVAYGTEAMHVLRAEKGYIIVGQESDGTVTPYDLGLGWAIGKSKRDFVGKRGLMRPDLTRAGRRQLVGLLTTDRRTLLEEGAQITRERNPAVGTPALGHVTSAYPSDAAGRPIALALLADGRKRIGGRLWVPMSTTHAIEVEVVSPVFYDREGERLDV